MAIHAPSLIAFYKLNSAKNSRQITTMGQKKLLLKALDADKQGQIDLLQAFIQAPSPNPPGDTAAAAAVLTNYLSSNGVPFNVIDPRNNNTPNIVSDFEGSLGPGPRVVLNGHIDVFPVGDGKGWKRDPWSGDVEGDRIHGRGVVDMKSGTASLLVAYTYLYQRRAFMTGSVALCLVSDEETGGKWGTKYLLEQDKKRWGGDVMLSAEPGNCSTIRFAEKGTLRLSVTVKTKGAHGAYLNLSKGAIRTATGFLSKIIPAVENMHVDIPEDIAKHLRKEEVKKAIDEAMGAGAASIITRPTVNVGTIKGGLKVNMIPDVCVFELDIRLPIGLLADQVLKTIRSIAPEFPDATIEVETQTAASNPYSFSSVQHPIIHCLSKNAANLAPSGTEPVAIPSMGATDCKHYRYFGVPAYVYGCSPFSSKLTSRQFHLATVTCLALTDSIVTVASVDESASVSEYLHVTKVHAAAVWDFLQE